MTVDTEALSTIIAASTKDKLIEYSGKQGRSIRWVIENALEEFFLKPVISTNNLKDIFSSLSETNTIKDKATEDKLRIISMILTL